MHIYIYIYIHIYAYMEYKRKAQRGREGGAGPSWVPKDPRQPVDPILYQVLRHTASSGNAIKNTTTTKHQQQSILNTKIAENGKQIL